MAERKILTGITAEAFVSDADRWALDKLKRVPLLPQLVQKFYEYGFDRWFYCMNMSMSVRCGPNQFPTLYRILQESAQILDMPEPELYVSANPFPNAWTSGVERPYITLRSSLVDALDDDQLYDVIGHELAHIKADHVLYRSVAAVLLPLLEMIGRRTLGLGDAAQIALVLAFYEWMRQAEFTADRGGLLVAQSLDTAIDATIILTAGRTRFAHEMNREAFMDQARAYQDAAPLEQVGKILIFLLYGHMFTHPMPVHRAQELEKWVMSGAYDRIMAGDYTRTPTGAGV